MKRWIVIIATVWAGFLAAGYHFTPSRWENTRSSIVPSVAKASLSMQATTSEQAKPQQRATLAEQKLLFEDTFFGYHLSYPLSWTISRNGSNVVVFQSPHGLTAVKVEAVGPLAPDDLTAFVDRSVHNDTVISRQSLTIHGLPAERVVAYSDRLNSHVTYFFINAGNSAYVITGLGEQKAIEMLARSFDGPTLAIQP